MRLRLYLKLWKAARKRALDALREEYPGEYDSARLTHSIKFFEHPGTGLTSVMNAQFLLSQDYALHDAHEGLL